jgi:hypothetical protein
LGTFSQVNCGSGHLAQGGQGGHLDLPHFSSQFILGGGGHAGQIGVSACDFKIYKSSCPLGIWLRETPLLLFELGLGLEFELENIDPFTAPVDTESNILSLRLSRRLFLL